MSKPKAGDSENKPRYVALYHSEMDSMAFKTLSPKAVWLLIQLRRAWRGNSDKIELPFSAVKWKLRFSAFDKARRELVEAGFLRVINPGGVSPAGKNPAIYAPFYEGWRGEVSKRLADDPKAGYCKDVRLKDGRRISIWYPTRPRSESQKNADRVRMVKMSKAKAGKKTAPEKKTQKGEIPKLYANRIRVANLLDGSSILRKGRAPVKMRELNDRN